MPSSNCPFCDPPATAIIFSEELVFAVWDGFPVNAGHALIIPKRHIPSLDAITAEENTALFGLLEEVKRHVIDRYKPDGFNIGINQGTAAGQTIPHLHVHLIPRYRGDVSDPTGGVRGVIPHKANYRRGEGARDYGPAALQAPHDAALIAGDDDALLPHLQFHIDRARQVDIAVAFTMVSGLNLIEDNLRDLLDRGGSLRFVTSDYLNATEPTALRRLVDLATSYEERIQVRAFATEPPGLPSEGLPLSRTQCGGSSSCRQRQPVPPRSDGQHRMELPRGHRTGPKRIWSCSRRLRASIRSFVDTVPYSRLDSILRES